MDVSFLTVLLCVSFCFFTLGISSLYAENVSTSICNVNGCNCTKKESSGKILNCNLSESQILQLQPGSVPLDLTEVQIHGGEAVTFIEKSLDYLPGLSILILNGTKKIILNSKSLYDLQYPRFILTVSHCDEVLVKIGAIQLKQNYFETRISSIRSLSLETEAFSKIDYGSFTNIEKFDLANGTFKFSHPGRSKIIFKNVKIQRIPHEAFYSSLAEIKFFNSHVQDICQGAFRASEIEVIEIINSSIGRLQDSSFRDRTLIQNFKIVDSRISTIESRAVMAAISNFSIHHSVFKEIETKAISSTVANVDIAGNQISNIFRAGLIFNNWNIIKIEKNIFNNLHATFLIAPANSGIVELSFKGNEINNIEDEAFNFINEIEADALVFRDNLFNRPCKCPTQNWIENLTNSSKSITQIMDMNYCTITSTILECFDFPVGVINITSFSEMICENLLQCKITTTEFQEIETTTLKFVDETYEKSSWIILILTIIGLCIVAIAATFIFLLIRGGRWLKRKGYFRSVHYNQNEESNDDENTVVTVDDESDKFQIPDELTLEFLQVLSKRLDDPATHQEASEMIERLYEMFVIEDNYDNIRQEHEAHLYEELGNMNLQVAPPPYEQDEPTENDARGILKIMEEKFNLHNDENPKSVKKPTLTGEYSEPSDAAEHLYSELKQNYNENNKSDEHSSHRSSDILTDNQASTSCNGKLHANEAGPSSKL